MIIDVTTVQRLVTKAAIAVAVARQLRDQLRRLADDTISFLCFSGEFLRRKGRRQTACRRGGYIVCRNCLICFYRKRRGLMLRRMPCALSLCWAFLQASQRKRYQPEDRYSNNH